MTVDRAHIEFKISVDKSDSSNSANFLEEEIDLFLSNAQEQYIELRAYPKKGEGLEETQKRVSDLQSITRNANISNFITNTDNKANGAFIELPPDYRHSLQEELTVRVLDCNNQTVTKKIPVLALQHDKYNNTIKNPFSTPNEDKAYRLPFGRFNNREHFEIITGTGVTKVTYHLRYLKNPQKIDKKQILNPLGLSGTQQIELPDSAVREVIDLAVYNALKIIESQRVQTAQQTFIESE